MVKEGYANPIYATAPTIDIASLLLYDSARIQEEDAKDANERKYTKHQPAKPLYSTNDVNKTIPYFTGKNYNEWVILNDEMKFCFRNSGHILGSAFIELICQNKRFIFSGDLGRKHSIFLPDKDIIKEANYIIIESTYGNKLHPKKNTKEELAQIIRHTYNKGGNLIIPSFVVERAQELIILINELRDAGEIPNIPLFLDSPMGVDFTEILCKYPDWHKLSLTACRKIYSNAHMIKDYKDSQKVIEDLRQKIIIAGSGMLTGGRVLHYLEKYLSDEKTSILLVGHQAEGTRGKALKDGVHELRFFGNYYPVHAEVFEISSLSAHADQQELVDWLKHLKHTPDNIFINHGEHEAADVFKVKLKAELNLDSEIAAMNVPYYLS